jgi:ketosteroid isomerase-like protein
VSWRPDRGRTTTSPECRAHSAACSPAARKCPNRRSSATHATAAAFYTADARLLAPSAELLTGRDAVARFWQAGIEAGVEHIELSCDEIDLEGSGDVAYEIGHYVLRLHPPDGPEVTDRGRYLLVHRRESDGGWRRAVETFNPDGDPERDGS